MVTKYDVFEYLYSNDKGKASEIAGALGRDYHVIYQILLGLAEQGLAKRSGDGFRAVFSKTNDCLFRIIRYSIANKVNYNELLDDKLMGFVKKALLKKEFTIDDFKLNPRTYSKYIDILSKNGLLILISRKPLTGILPYNSFLGDILLHFGFRPLARRLDGDYLTLIHKELDIFRKLRKKNERAYQQIIDDFEIKFIHHSLSLEGNPITLPQTIRLLKDHMSPADMHIESIEEVRNYSQALSHMFAEVSSPLSVDMILNYHYLAMKHKDFAGRLRKVPVMIKNNPDFGIAKADEIQEKLVRLLAKYNEFITAQNDLCRILEFSAFFHNEFQHIHPFLDGNSRTTRLITFHLLQSKGIPVFDIPLGLLESYMNATKAVKIRDDKELYAVLQLMIVYNLKTINLRLAL